MSFTSPLELKIPAKQLDRRVKIRIKDLNDAMVDKVLVSFLDEGK